MVVFQFQAIFAAHTGTLDRLQLKDRFAVVQIRKQMHKRSKTFVGTGGTIIIA